MPTTASASPATRLRAQWAERWADQPLSLPQFGVDTSAGWLSRVLRCTGPEQDEILTALLDAVADGEEAAERALLQLLVPAVDRIAVRTRLLAEYSAADRSGLVIAAVWEAIRCGPHHSVRRHVYVTYRRASISLLAPRPSEQQRGLEAATDSVDPAVLVDLAGAAVAAPVPAELQLARLLAAAVRARVVTAEEVDLLQRSQLEGCGAEEVGKSVGLAPVTVRKRVQRTTDLLRRAVEVGDL